MRQQRAAIYGGTFDPVHHGHLEVARHVQRLFALDVLIFVPACVPPHKRNAGITSAFHRFAMLALATENDDRLQVSTIELDQPDRPYAVETVARMQEKLGGDFQLFFVMGADSWSEITTWREWQRLLTMCDQIVVTRPGYDLDAAAVDEAKIIDARGLSAEQIVRLAAGPNGPRTFFTNAVFADVSATAIRDAARNRSPELRKMVPSAVADYIEKYELYRK